ncbi:MAG: hypothetical protein JO280_03305 [Mycobacteriaceae bacterium]|nr:hypothetical protein [Mycobacteriaceae bacterium]
MEIVLGVSTTPTTVRMVLVEGEMADGVIVDHDVFDITSTDGAPTSSAPKQVINAVLGTQEAAIAGGHHLVATGVTSCDQAEASALREALSVSGIDDVMLFPELHAAGALAQTIGRAVEYDATALMFIQRETATLSVVRTIDGATTFAVTRGLKGADAMAVLTEMVTGLKTHEPRPDGMFVVGSGGVDATAVKSNLENLVSMPVRAPDEPELALARAAALAAANAPRVDASTVGLAYSQQPDEAATGTGVLNGAKDTFDDEENRKPFLLAGSALATMFAVGVVALVVSLAVHIQPAADQRTAPAPSAMHPGAVVPVPPKVQNVQPKDSGAAPQTVVPAPAPPVASAPIPSQPAAPALQEVAPAPAAPVPAAAGPPAPAAPVGTPPAILPAPVIQLPVPGLPPILLTPGYSPPAVTPPWYPVPPQPQWRQPWHGRHGGE